MPSAEPFEYGAEYETVTAFDALRDRFERGERMLYWRMAYSRYDGLYGFFFRQPDFRVRSWDLSSLETAIASAPRYFRRVAAPAPLIVAAQQGDSSQLGEPGVDGLSELVRELALERATSAGHAEFVAGLLAISPTSDKHLQRLLAHAARKGQARVVSQLLDLGVEVDKPDGLGQTALFGAATSGDAETVRVLLASGANPNHEANGNSPLSLAKAWKHPTIVALLSAKD